MMMMMAVLKFLFLATASVFCTDWMRSRCNPPTLREREQAGFSFLYLDNSRQMQESIQKLVLKVWEPASSLEEVLAT